MKYYIMTSINIQCLTDRSNFTNFFSNPITIPKNTQIAMPKANLKLAVRVNYQIYLPQDLTIGMIAFRVEIDGIAEDITWGDIFAAHQDLPGVETFNTFNEWWQNYIYEPCNQVIFYNNNTNQAQVKTDFNTILARAITQKYDFYVISPSPTYTNILEDELQISGVFQTITQVAGANTYEFLENTDNYMKELGFNVEYAPVKMFEKNQGYINVNALAKVNWVQGGAAHSLRGSTGACCAYINGIDVDYNGGYIQSFPNCTTANAGGLMSFGFDFLGAGTQPNDEKHPFNTGYDTTMYDIGIEFGYDGANFVYNILTKANQYNSTTDTPILHSGHLPHKKVNGFDNNGDHFFIQITRSNDLHNSNAWVVNILQGVNLDPNTDPNAVVVYSETFNFNPQTNLVPLYQCNAAAGVDAWEFNNNGFIPRSAQTTAQGDMALQGNTHNLGSFVIEPQVEQTNINSTRTSWAFWNSWGLFNSNIYPLNDRGGRNVYFQSVEGNTFTRQWKNPTNFNVAPKTYILGNKTFNELYEYLQIANNDFLTLRPNVQIGSLPQIICVAINNIDVKNFNGVLPYGSINNGITDVSNGDGRVVGTIPFPIDQIREVSVIVDIIYEPYNLLYRPINNPNMMTINQLNVEMFFKDEGLLRNIDNIVGNANIEFHIRSGGTPAPPNKAGLRPY